MRQAIGGTWLIQLMILFILLFAGYIILTMNYSKTIKVKNEVVSIIEKYEGINSRSIELVNSYLMASGYLTMGTCQSGAGIYGNSDYTIAAVEPAQSGKKYYYCLKKYKGANTTSYYQVTVFYRFNLPVLGDISSFMVKGTTLNFQAEDDMAYCQSIDGSCTVNTPRPSTNPGGSSMPSVQSYTVSFDVSGGLISIPSQTISSGGKVLRPSNPTRDGYVFDGWTLSGSDYNFNNSVTSNITLVAKWKKSSSTNISYTVTFDLDGGVAVRRDGHGSERGTTIPSQQVVSGDKVYTPPTPYKYSPQSTFDGWELNGSLYDFNKPVTSNIVLKAKWAEKIRVTLTSSCGVTKSITSVNNGENTYNEKGGHVFYMKKGDTLAPLINSSNEAVVKTGLLYGDNEENNEHSYITTFHNVAYWKASDGRVFNLNTPINENYIILTAVCK